MIAIAERSTLRVIIFLLFLARFLSWPSGRVSIRTGRRQDADAPRELPVVLAVLLLIQHTSSRLSGVINGAVYSHMAGTVIAGGTTVEVVGETRPAPDDRAAMITPRTAVIVIRMAIRKVSPLCLGAAAQSIETFDCFGHLLAESAVIPLGFLDLA